jgi:putative ABC transport system permease protein
MRWRELDRLRKELAGHAAFSLRIALDAVRHNRLRGALTSLGILFGVASVIAMLAIGRGAQREILEQMKLLGSNNIVVTPLVEQKEGDTPKEEDEKEQKRFSPGLTVYDARSIASVIPDVDAASGELVLETMITREGRRRSGKLVGIDTSYFRMLNMSLSDGATFSDAQVLGAAPVCIIGQGVRSRFFTTEEPLGRRIKVGDTWLTVVGVLEDRQVPEQTSQRLGIRDANMDVYVPLTTALLRYRNRSQVTSRDIERASQQGEFVANDGEQEDPEQQTERTNLNQLDRIIVRVREAALVPGVAEVMQRMLARRHNQVVDYEIVIPELLLAQERRTRTIFNIVLGAIASISLIVGGIGIMNIMLASVLERIREIGVRRAVGATRRDILAQFLSEAVLISIAGGIAGIVLGFALAVGIERIADIRAIVSPLSVVLAFGVSFAVGVAFGIMPAYRAAQQDPVVSLRYE